MAHVADILPEIFEQIRPLLAEQVGISIEEVAFESHLYYDLGMNSLDVIESIIAIEESLSLALNDDLLSHLVKERTGGSWMLRKIVLNIRAFRLLDAIRLPALALKRDRQIRRMCEQHEVDPYSAGFLCACVYELRTQNL